MQHIQEVEELFQSKRKNGEKLYVLLDGACRENAFGLILCRGLRNTAPCMWARAMLRF